MPRKRRKGSPPEPHDVKAAISASHETPAPVRNRQRVVSKGNNVPTASESFADMQDRFQFSSRLMQNLEAHGYTTPTGIQCHAIPILMEVTML